MSQKIQAVINQCYKLGLVEQARLLEAKFSVELPHLRHELDYLEDLYDLFRSIASVDPESIPKNMPILRTLPQLDTGSKTQRQIVGQIGYLLNVLYRNGYQKHNLVFMRKEVRNKHLEFGTKLQDLIGSIGVYYNSTDPYKSDIGFNEGQLGNNRLVSHSRALDKLVNGLEIQIEKYIEKEGLSDFDQQSLSSVHDQIEAVRNTLNRIIRTVNKVSSLPLGDIDMLKKDINNIIFFTGLFDKVDSQLDVSRDLTLPNLAFKAVQLETKTGKVEKIEPSNLPPALRHHASSARAAGEMYDEQVRTLKAAKREFREAKLALARYNEKAKRFVASLDDAIVNDIPIAIDTLSQAQRLVANFLSKRKINGEPATRDKLPSVSDEDLAEWLEIVKTDESLNFDEGARAISQFFVNSPFETPRSFFSADYAACIKALDNGTPTCIKSYLNQAKTQWASEVVVGTFVPDPGYDVDYLLTELTARLKKLSKNPLDVIDDEQALYTLFSYGVNGLLSGQNQQRTEAILDVMLQKIGLDPSSKKSLVHYIDNMKTILRKISQEGVLEDDKSSTLKEYYDEFQAYVQEVSDFQRKRQENIGRNLILTESERGNDLTTEAILSRLSTIDPKTLVTGEHGYFVKATSKRKAIFANENKALEVQFTQEQNAPVIGRFTAYKKWVFTADQECNVTLTRYKLRDEDKKEIKIATEQFPNKFATAMEMIEEVTMRYEKELVGGASSLSEADFAHQFGSWLAPRFIPSPKPESDFSYDNKKEKEILETEGPKQLLKVEKEPSETKKRQPTSIDTIRQNAVQFTPRIPVVDSRKIDNVRSKLELEYQFAVKYKTILSEHLEKAFALIKETTTLTKTAVGAARSSNNVDTAARIFINAYQDIQIPKAAWVDWKSRFSYAGKMMKQTLAGLETSVESSTSKTEHFRGITIDKVYSKFEDLVTYSGIV